MRLGTLLRNEVLKLGKRPAFWVIMGFFTFVTLMDLGEEFYEAMKDPSDPFALPASWGQIFGQPMVVGAIFAAVLLVLLTASEFPWRTARQNVIDGLSRSELFAGKLMLLPLLSVLFVAERVLVGGVLALVATAGTAGGPPIGGSQWAAIGGFTLATAGYASLALAAALAIRSSGPAMAVWFFYFAVGENLLRGGLGAAFEGLRPALSWLPLGAFGRLTSYVQYDPEAFRRAAEAAVRAERPGPLHADLGAPLLATGAWIVFFVVVSYLSFRRRDL
ncbi:MAG: hypothetical protein ACE5HF_08955 [Gemmatimonadota bacterium]